MFPNPDMTKRLAEEYRKDRLREAEQARLAREAQGSTPKVLRGRRLAHFTRLMGKPVLAFFTLAFAISWAAFFLERAARQALFPDAVLFTLNLVVKFGPSAAGLIVVGATELAGGIRELLSGLLKWRVALHWYVLALFGPAALMLAAITLSLPLGSRALEDADWQWPRSAGLLLSLFATRFFIGGGLGEELGWRGFALPRLQPRYGHLRASLLIGLMWGLWHLPGNLSSNSPLLALLAQMILTLSLSIIFSWVYHRTGGSLLVVSLLHAANNAYSAFFETTLPALGDEIGWIALYVVFIIGVAAIVIRKAGLASSPRGRLASELSYE